MADVAARLKHLAQMFQDVDSPEQLGNLMREGGAIAANMIASGRLQVTDFERELAQSSKEQPVPIWDNSRREFIYHQLFFHLGERYSDRPRAIQHTVSTDGSSAVQETRWQEDFKQQGKQYSLFCAELLAELADTDGRQREVAASVGSSSVRRDYERRQGGDC